MRKPLLTKLLAGAALVAAASGSWAQGQVNIICSVQAEWCNLMSTVYAKTTGTKVNMTAKGSGEALAQLNAERANPKTDIWFGGTGDPHLQAAEQGLTLEYKSPQLAQLYPWAQKQAADSKYRTVGVYLGRWALATTRSCWPSASSTRPSRGPTCSSPSSRARYRWPTPHRAAPPTP